jgi:hypothetical protein
MSNTPYTIKLFMPNGNPNSIKVIEKMNWTGVGVEMSRDDWETHKTRKEFDQAGIYVLIGYDENSDLPKAYIGQGDGIRKRIDSHYKEKAFWEKLIIFVSSNNGLNKGHITWLEYALIGLAKKHQRCVLDNSVTPNEPVLTESEKADTNAFLNEMLSIFPLVEIKIFDKPKFIDVDKSQNINVGKIQNIQDTIVIPANSDGFTEVFLNQNCWYAIRIGGGKLNEIKYIAAYQTAPISAITHYAEVDSIEAYGDGTKYKLNFKGKAIKLENQIPFGGAKTGSLQSSRYTSLEKMLKAKTVKEVF